MPRMLGALDQQASACLRRWSLWRCSPLGLQYIGRTTLARRPSTLDACQCPAKPAAGVRKWSEPGTRRTSDAGNRNGAGFRCTNGCTCGSGLRTKTDKNCGFRTCGPGRRGRPRKRKNPGKSRGFHRAGDRTRTGDMQLGKLPLYQLSYARIQDWLLSTRNVDRAGSADVCCPQFAQLTARTTSHNPAEFELPHFRARSAHGSVSLQESMLREPVRSRGLEPPRYCYHQALNLTRLPISPRPLVFCRHSARRFVPPDPDFRPRQHGKSLSSPRRSSR